MEEAIFGVMEEYFSPVSLPILSSSRLDENFSLGRLTQIHKTHFPSLDGKHIALIGVPEDRNTINSGSSKAADAVRSEFYKLMKGYWDPSIVDLGNLIPGATYKDTYSALSYVVDELLRKGVIPVILGGGHDLTFAQYMGMEKHENSVEAVVIDSRMDLGDVEEGFDSNSVISQLIVHQPSHLFNISFLGYQAYYVPSFYIDVLEKVYFDYYRLGWIRDHLQEAEPILRNAHMLSVDMGALKASEAPGHIESSPNGFYGEEICQLMRYAGLSNQMRTVGIYELNPDLDPSGISARQAAQMIWFFVDGFYNRRADNPFDDTENYVKYRAVFKDGKHELVFYKSKKTDRWWMEVPYPEHKRANRLPYLIPCSYKDYESACREEMPDRWWRAHQKLL